MMTDAEKHAFTAALAELASFKAGAKLTVTQYAAWWNQFRQTWTLEEFRCACRQLNDQVEFMPNPFHFAQLRRASGLQAPEAWVIVRECARRGDRLPADIDPAVRKAVDALGGLRAIGFTHSDQMRFLEHRFAEHFATLQASQGARETLGVLPPPESSPRLVRDLVASKRLT